MKGGNLYLYLQLSYNTQINILRPSAQLLHFLHEYETWFLPYSSGRPCVTCWKCLARKNCDRRGPELLTGVPLGSNTAVNTTLSQRFFKRAAASNSKWASCFYLHFTQSGTFLETAFYCIQGFWWQQQMKMYLRLMMRRRNLVFVQFMNDINSIKKMNQGIHQLKKRTDVPKADGPFKTSMLQWPQVSY